MVPRKRLLITRRLTEAVLARIGRDYEGVLNTDDRPLTGDEIVARAEGCDGVICAPGDPLDGDVVSRLPDSVRAIATFSVGYDHLDVAAAKQRGIRAFNTPGVLTDSTADITLLLLLGAARRAFEGQRMLRAGQWAGWTPTQLLGRSLAGKRLGILGMGRIGNAVAHRARAFELEIHYCNRHRLGADRELGATFHTSPRELMRGADFFSLHCPATPETHHFLDAERIDWLPDHAIVVNTARGAVVDDAALIDALRSGRIAAAGLDVFEGEPDVHPGYRALDNVYILPHMGSATIETRDAMGHRALDNLDAFFAGRNPPDSIE
ncbi:MAG: D-glycerate dehydrogenase [Myxococcales bacterium]|nr:D-glycerate dehydrogenase [Myxococcales bacterium]